MPKVLHGHYQMKYDCFNKLLAVPPHMMYMKTYVSQHWTIGLANQVGRHTPQTDGTKRAQSRRKNRNRNADDRTLKEARHPLWAVKQLVEMAQRQLALGH